MNLLKTTRVAIAPTCRGQQTATNSCLFGRSIGYKQTWSFAVLRNLPWGQL